MLLLLRDKPREYALVAVAVLAQEEAPAALGRGPLVV
jgi:hypothetical protein